ncbi:hypothetical protein MCV29_08520 [Enterobacter asburiae]|uniref:hypothetical protein n=1 Tax=Enterobacter asburiae TaxID=61645 RepID=UPI001EF99848|nr:hypothetical protein [Enterobacter asburiae]MCG7801270.1 hypothetical protein [Enterobacter asburiae]
MEDNNLGAWSKEDLKDTLTREIVTGRPLVDDNYGDNWAKFKVNVMHELRRRYSGNIKNDSSCIFILENNLFSLKDSDFPNLKKSFTISSGRKDFAGKIFITTFQNQRGYYFEDDFSDIDKIIESITELNLLNNPCIFFNNFESEKVVEFYPNGFNNDYEDKIEIVTPQVTEEFLFKVFDKAYQTSLITPTALNNAGCHIWQDASKFIPSDQVEKKIQRTLYTALATNLDCELMPLNEVSIEDGRLDFLILSKETQGKLNSHAVVELKALRSMTQSGKEYVESVKKEWVTKGMHQVITFSQKFTPSHSILSCYDMSKNDYSDDYWFSDTKELAELNEVKQWRWRIYNTAEARRR